MFLSSFAVSPHPSPLPSFCFSPANSGSNETSIWPVRKTQTSLPLWEEETSSAQGGRTAPWIVKRMWTVKNWTRADDDVLHAGSVVSCFLSPWRAVLVWDEQVYRRGRRTAGRIKGNSVRAKCAKTPVRNGRWVMKKSPKMHWKPGQWCFLFRVVVKKCWRASWFVIRRISRKTNALKHQPLLKVIWLSVTLGHNWRC